jgi:hypothetical protein
MERPAAKIVFKGLEILEKSMQRRPDEGVNITAFNFDVNVESRLNPNERSILVIVRINLKEGGKDPNIASITTVCLYVLDNYDEVLLKNDGATYEIPADLNTLLQSVSVSTVRGIMYSEFRGTYITAAILPVIVVTPDMIQTQQPNPLEKSATP